MKVWTINVQVNAQYFISTQDNEIGTWEHPADTGALYKNNINIAAVSDDPGDAIVVGDGDNIVLPLDSEDIIQWVLSDVNPVYANRIKSYMIGFNSEINCASLPGFYLLPELMQEIAIASVQTGFNAKKEPAEQWLNAATADIVVPQQQRVNASANNTICHMHIAVVGIADTEVPAVLRVIKISPKIIVN
ncbi:hypothetical protein RP726_20085 [Candidatus Methylospira mobilis]|uniref:hypothetical protein n=1 Tax=Candidatus Methylospira mobilis TaxID=1808979 RepID=UPI0028EC59D0|nr:hypothetical protein [Candidatus Methylospira mobilis]WNV04664.1 hypothetical protein RP726_20085 [Candidatus Methylospira mobilis]